MGENQARDTKASIEELTEAVRRDEQRKAEIAALLREIKESLGESRLRSIEERLAWVEKYVEANYNLLTTLVQVMASNVADGKRQLNGVQKALAQRTLERELIGLKISAARDAVIEGDVGSGKDKE